MWPADQRLLRASLAAAWGRGALEAARRQSEPGWLLAMLREQGELAFENRDRAAAEALWGRMLNLVITPDQAKSRRAPTRRPAAAGPARSQPASTPAPAPAPALKR